MNTKLLALALVLASFAPYALADHTGVGPIDTIVHSQDQDDDGIFDDVESRICGTGFVAAQVDATDELTGIRCASTTDLDYGERTATVTVPGNLSIGDDDDMDGVPLNVTVQFFDVTIDANGREVSRERNMAADVDQILDDDDGDPNVPAQRIFEATLPGNFDLGVDDDGDGFPDAVTILFFDFTVNTITGDVDQVANPAEDVVQAVDDDDSDPNVPVQRIFEETVPSNVAFGPDLDMDGIPATARVERSDLMLDTRDGSHAIVRNAGADTTETLDQDDSDPNVPVQRIFATEAPSGVAPGADADGDGIPADATVEVNETTLDTRTGDVESVRAPGSDETQALDADDADPNVPVQRIFEFNAPSGFDPGVDGDGDGFPGTATILFNTTTVDTRDGSSDSVRAPTEDVEAQVDTDDSDPASPVVEFLEQVAPCGVTPGGDADQDGIPVDVTVESCTYRINTHTGDVQSPANDAGDETTPLDAADGDPNVPVQRVFAQVAPCGLTPGDDDDGDTVPVLVTVESCTFDIDTIDGTAVPVANDAGDEEVALDADDDDPNVPLQRVFEQTLLCDAVPGADLDEDNLPDDVTLSTCDFTVNSLNGQITSPPSAGPGQVQDVDADDGDENVPVQRVLGVTIPTGATAGADTDSDGVPSTATITFETRTIDTRDGTVTPGAAPSQSQPVDPAANDIDQPLPCGTGVTVPVGAPAFTQIDADGDGILGGIQVTAAGQQVRICGNGVFPTPTASGPVGPPTPGADRDDADPCVPVGCPLTGGNNRRVLVLRSLVPVQGLDGFASMRSTTSGCAPVAPPCFQFEASLWDMDCEPVPFTSATFKYRTISTSLGESQMGPYGNGESDNSVRFNVPQFFFAAGAGSGNLVAYFKATFATSGDPVVGVVDYLTSRLAPLPGAPAPQPDLPCRLGDTFDEGDTQNLGASTPFLVQFA